MSIAKLEVSGSSKVQTEVHRSICTFVVFPLLQGCVSPQGVQDNAEENPRFKVNIAVKAREAEVIPRRCSACSRSGGMGGVPSLGALSVTCSPTAAPAPDRVRPQCHTLPQHCFCERKATSLHNNLNYGIKSEERQVAIHRRLYLNVTTAIQWCRVYLALCVGTMRHQTLTIHTTNRKLPGHLFKGTDQTHQVRIQVTTCWYLVQFPCS